MKIKSISDAHGLRSFVLQQLQSDKDLSCSIKPYQAADLVANVNGLDFRFSFAYEDSGMSVTAHPGSKEAARNLRNLAAPISWLVRSQPNSYHIVRHEPLNRSTLQTTISRLASLLKLARLSWTASSEEISRKALPMYWWDSRSNFGDEVGPWIGTKISGLHAVNMRGTGKHVPTIMSVGSIFAQLEHAETSVWGTGLIAPLSKTQVASLAHMGEPKIYALRGRLSAKEISEKLGWSVPAVFGDPALLIPRYYEPTPAPDLKDKVAYVPHYAHSFLRAPDSGKHFSVDVTEDLESVVQQISQAKVVVSTSLHGIIVAQAFGVPWVWLRITDKPLKGGDFKFRDFFTTLDTDNPPIYDSRSDESVDVEHVSSFARIPDLAVDLNTLEEAFPLPRSGTTERRRTISNLLSLSSCIKKNTLAVLKKGVINRLDLTLQSQQKNLEIQRHMLSNLMRATQNSETQIERLAGLEKAQTELLRELKLIRSETTQVGAASDVSRRYIQAQTYSEIRSALGDRQKSPLETINILASTDCSFARFGDGEFRLLGHPDEDISFQTNSLELREQLASVLQSTDGNLLVGFPQIYKDTNWSGIWAEIWPEVKNYVPKDRVWGNAHVTRPFIFKKYRDSAVEAWRGVWNKKSVCVISGKDSRFELVPELFDNVASTSRIDSLERDAFQDIPRLLALAKSTKADMFLIALGPGGTVLAHELAKSGLRGLDIGHLPDSYLNVYKKAKRPEYKPVQK